MQWFEEWFDSPLYEKIYSNRDEEEANQLVGFLTEIIPPDKYERILDLGCGRGRHSINMGQRGYLVTGIDLSEEAITVARAKSFAEELREVSFVVGDMREPYPDIFDAVVNLFTSFGYFDSDEENKLVINNVSQMVIPGGMFVLDFLNVHKAAKELVPQEEGSLDKMDYSIKRYVNNDTLVKEIIFRQKNSDLTHVFAERVKMYNIDWFEDNLSRAGFELQEVYGDYRGAAFNPEKSPRLMMVAKKL